MLNDIRALTPRIRELAPGIAATGTIPAALHSRLARTGVFRLAAPRWAGGVEADPLVTAGVLEELGWADGSARWRGWRSGSCRRG
jgi:alkylation response protein AidB-like acyl-CoA dehydrogenase